MDSFRGVGDRVLAEEESGGGPSDKSTNIFLIFLCVLCAACASGLTQGLLSLNYTEMVIKSRSGTELEKKYAKRLLPIIRKHHLLLVTLMLWNATATEALPIFLNKVVPEFVAIIISVTLVLVVGEIIPAAILTGPRQLELAYAMAPMVWVVSALLFCVAYPISLLLDYLLGCDEGVTVYNRRELATMVHLQHEAGKDVLSQHEAMDREEAVIIGNALKFREMRVSSVMTKLANVYMLSNKEKLTYKVISEIFKNGYSRIPVYEGTDTNDIVGIILVKDLLTVDPADGTPVFNFLNLFGRKVHTVWHDDKLGDALRMFKANRAHLAVVRDVNDKGTGDPYYEAIGIITMEDILEEILGEEIEDETDHIDSSLGAKLSRDLDMARLRLLNPKFSDDHLGESEVKVIAAHFLQNVSQFKTLFSSLEDIKAFILSNGIVVTVTKDSENSNENILYKRGKVSTSCLLILNGQVSVHAGKDGFVSELGPWSTIAADALINPAGMYIPDFSCFVTSETLRGLRLTFARDAMLSKSSSNEELREIVS